MLARSLPLVFAALFVLSAAFASGIEFTPAEIADWPQREFDGPVTYRLVENGRPAVEAIAENGATALYREIEIDVSETPWLEWSWRVDALPRGEASEREKAGDDYGVRIYVVQEGFFGKLSARALNYVWSRELEAGTRWPNAFTSRARMISVEQGDERLGEWITYRRDLREDWQAAFGEAPGTIHGIAIMTDSDNTDSRAAARYGSIRLRARE
ncbi:MAG: DUF3047 domain-containing protein [Halioglobus sp.]|nr:DUF3047 domain-containing protein [Halioglobus sp.]